MRQRHYSRKWVGGLIMGLVLAGSGSVAAESQIDESGVASLTSQDSVEDVDARFRQGLEKRGMGLMAMVDHQANAEGVGLELPPTRTYIFGKPEVGTRLMQCHGSTALDLPQKMVVRQQDDHLVLEWNDPHYLAKRHGLGDCELPIDQIAQALSGLAQEAAGD
ncbi:DUF302 domain-containing protein [Halomonas sp. DP8Y7-3]|uniref:DUF302 domain-containing protein n=1 Tax=Halomonas sp. DP8Y7-3 TaxID=2859079 RepID=UPI001C983B94|nr:DUF302 domain-containing protein [Halomonas sp. DP8Y7-3]MBY5929748.1 DUF302 domain-containing protein [Halomonas sp. DP8Y7-3]